MDWFDLGVLLIRLFNAILWTLVGLQVLRRDRPIPRLAWQLIVTAFFFGMWVLVIGGLVPFGMPGDIARWLYTVFAAYAAILALGLLKMDD